MSTSLRVLIVEDSRADAHLLLRELRQGGYDPAFEQVDTPEAMNEALDKEEWDIVLADYVMPRFCGMAALELLKARGIDLPLIVVSGKIGEDVAVEAMKAGANDYIVKGNLARLLPAIQRELREAEVRRGRKQAEETLRQERERMVAERAARAEAETARQQITNILESITDAFFALDHDWRFTFVNKEAERLLRRRREDLMGKRVWDEFPEAVGSTFCRRYHEAITKQVSMAFEEFYPPLDRWLDVRAYPARDGLSVYFRDVSERKRAEAECNRLLEHLRKVNRQLEDFIHSVSHDLRNPLQVIQGQAQLLQRTMENSGRNGIERRSAEAIGTSAKRMNVMIQDLVDSARAEGGQLCLEKQRINLRQFLRRLLDRSDGVMDTGRIAVEISFDLPEIPADTSRLERILLNLLTNALKYSHPHSEVVVRARSIDAEVEICVADQGIGIPPEDLPHIFDRYYRASSARGAEGVGLGLFITRTLVLAHGGHIWAESELGKGSAFYFTLPLEGPVAQNRDVTSASLSTHS